MSEKKQIEEIRKDIFAAFGGYAKWEEDWQSLAEAVYNAGYRKQSEGVWELGRSGCMYYCSECKYAAHPREVDEWSHCPRCGAKMKGV